MGPRENRRPSERRYLLYCFDLDDTLVATFPHAISVLYPELSSILGVPPPSAELVRQTWGRPLGESLRTLFPHAGDPRRVARLLLQTHSRHPIPAHPRAADIIRILRSHGRAVALFSAGDPALVGQTLTLSLGLDPHSFDHIYFLAHGRETKGDTGILDRMRTAVMARAGYRIDPCDTLVVGDDPRDWLLACEGGADFKAVATGIHSGTEHLGAGVPEGCIFPTLAAALAAPVDHGVVAVIKDSEQRFLLVREARGDSPYLGHWSGPHGTCQANDVLEEETVARETREECGLDVLPIRRLYVRPADTKVKTVAFWNARRRDLLQMPRIVCPREVSEIGWFTLDQIRHPDFPLYFGTRDFFSRYEELIQSKETDLS